MTRDLKQLLFRQDWSHLWLIGKSLNINLSENDIYLSIDMLLTALTDKAIIEKLSFSFSENDWKCICEILYRNGIINANEIEKKYGVIRIFGQKRLAEEKVWEYPQTTTESLWIKGLIYRIGKVTDQGITEQYVIPGEISTILEKLKPINEVLPVSPPIICRPALPEETVTVELGDFSFLDAACLILAADRSNKSYEMIEMIYGNSFVQFVSKILHIIINTRMTSSEQEMIRQFLIKPSADAIFQITNFWVNSENYNEFVDCGFFSIVFLGDVNLCPSTFRKKFLKIIFLLEKDTWLSFNSFSSVIEKNYPEFFRSIDEDNKWTLHNKILNKTMAGSGEWKYFEEVYFSFLLFGPLHWLGFVDCAWKEKEKINHGAFRLKKNEMILLEAIVNQTKLKIKQDYYGIENGSPMYSEDGVILCRKDVPRAFRYQAARVCDWEKIERDRWCFRITNESMKNATQFGMTPGAFLTLMKRFGKTKIPKGLELAILDLEKNTGRVSMYSAELVTSLDTAVIDQLLENRDLSRWIIQRINPNTITIKSGGKKAVRRVLIKMGILVESEQKEF